MHVHGLPFLVFMSQCLFLHGLSTFLHFYIKWHLLKLVEGGVIKGVASPAPKAKRTKRAGSNRLGSAVTLQAQNYTDAEELAMTSNDEVSQKERNQIR